MNCVQIARNEQIRIHIFPHQERWESPDAVVSSGEESQVICLDVVTATNRWLLEIRGRHYGSPCLPIRFWPERSCLVVALEERLHFLAIEDGRILSQRDFRDELYINDMLVESRGRLLVGTARSLFAFASPGDMAWEFSGIATDGVSIVAASMTEVVVACEDPGEVPTIKRFAI